MTVQESNVAGADRWMEAAFELAHADGLAVLSSRAIASRTGGSASAINYYFGNRRAMIGELAGRAVAASEVWRQSRRSSDMGAMPVWIDLAGAFTATLQARMEDSRSLLTLLRELGQEALANRWDEVSQVVADEEEAEARFWEDVAHAYGAPAETLELWGHLALALASMCLALPSASNRSIWIATPVQRLQRRLERLPVSLVRDDAHEIASVETSPPRYTESAHRILDAALRVIAEKGPDRLSQREVASAAGVSLSAVTYFFGAKHDLISASFDELCRREYRAIKAAVERELPGGDLLSALSAAANSDALGLMEVLMHAAMRQPTLAAAVDRMLAIRGIGSEILLQKLGMPADRLDGYLWISMTAGGYRRLALLPDFERTAAMQSAAVRRLNAMFGPIASASY